MKAPCVQDLKDEIAYLRSLLDANGIEYDFESYSRIQARVDVYAKRSKDKGYFQQCVNFWKWGVCPKRDNTSRFIVFDFDNHYE